MEQLIIYLLIGAVLLVRFILKAKGKNNQVTGKGQRKIVNRSQTTQKPSSSQREIYKQLGLEDLFEQIKEKQSPSQSRKKPEQKLSRPLTLREERLKREAAEAARKQENEALRLAQEKRQQQNHFSESFVIDEIESAHKQGKEMEHHVHNYLSEKDDVYSEDYLRIYALPENKVKKPHPLTKIFQSSKDLRNAIIIKELLERKH